MNATRNLRLSRAIHCALGLSIAASAVMPGAVIAQEEDVAELERVQVTGSRISRQDMEGATPVTVYDREALDISGEISVADFLRETTFNSFGSFRESSGNSAQSQATISLRGVGSQRTLVLVDGRRLPGSPVLGGAVQNLNTIPMAAVERIDILRDGASAIYGSDAVGGVINIILRKDYEGLQIAMSHGDMANSDADEVAYTLVGGVSSGRGNVTWTIDHSERGLVYNRESAFVDEDKGLDTRVGVSPYGFPGSYGLNGIGINPITGEDEDISSDIVPDARCPSSLGSSAEFPNSSVAPFFGGGNMVCAYNFANVSASMASTRRTSLSVMTAYDISDSVEAFGRFTYSRHQSFGVYAPAPAAFGGIIDSTHPNYPSEAPTSLTWYADPITGAPTDPTTPGALPQTTTGPLDLDLYFRTVPLGTRDGDVRDYQLDIVTGIRGYADIFRGVDWEIAAQHNRFEIDEFGNGYGLVSVFTDLVASGQLNPFGNPDAATLASVLQTTAKVANMTFKGIDGQASMDLFDLPYGTAAGAFGFEYADESFSEDYDAQSSAGNVFGSAGNDTGGGRTRKALFAEFLFPIVSTLEAGLALRYDDYSDFGNTVNPKVSFRWTPTDELLFRGSYGESFIAPDLGTLYAAPAFSAENGIDTLLCEATGGVTECTARQIDTTFLGAASAGADLQPETAQNFTLGAVWSPQAMFSIGLDYYDISLENVIVQAIQPVLDAEADGRTFPGAEVIRDGSGRIVEIIAPPVNGKGFETSGFDLDIQKGWEVGDFGTLLTGLQWSYILGYEQELLEGAGVNDILDLAGNPDNRGALSFTWMKGPFTANMIYNVLPSTTAGETGDWESTSSVAADRLDRSIDAWNTVDLQFSYAAPWNGKLTAGARNITDQDPPLDSVFGHPYYDNQLYNPFGRVTYVRYTQDF